MKSNKVLSCFDIFLIAGVVLTTVLYSVLSGEADLLGSAAGIAGVVCVVLVAKGNIWNYFFGVINVSLYAWISFKAGLYGDAGLNALYYFPMQFIGLWQWKKLGARSCRSVDVRKMNWKQRTVLFSVCTVLVLGGTFLLKYLDDPQPLKDSLTTVLSIIAQALMAMAFMEQWILWIITNVVSIVMWSVCLARGEAHAGLMVIMWCFYLLNSVNGFRIWQKLGK